MKISLFYRVAIALFLANIFGFYLAYEGRSASEAGEDFHQSENKSEIGSEMISKNKASGAAERRTAKIEFLIRTLENLNSKNSDAEERIQIAQELSKAYFDTGLEGFQMKISKALSHALRQEDSLDVVRFLALSHSRLYFDENTMPNIKYAYDLKAISFDEYHGELAHIYPGAPVENRSNIIREISLSNNRYAVDIISDSVVSENDIRLSSKEISDLYLLLETNEPIFSGSPDAFGYFDAILYSNWLVATSRLKNKKYGISIEQILRDKLLDPGTDPRASVAFLISPYARSMSGSQRSALRWDAIELRAREFMRQNPDSSGLQQIGQEMLSGGGR